MFFMFRNIAVLAAASAIVNASPVPGGVTSDIAPKASPPAGCAINFPGEFGIAVVRGSGSATPSSTSGSASSGSASASTGAGVVTVQPDGQPGPSPSAPSPKPTPPPKSAAVVSQIKDGQPQAASIMHALQQISDGQVQHQTTVVPITQIADGQIQASYSPVIVKSTIVKAVPVTIIADGQPQASTSPSFITSVKTSTTSALATSTPRVSKRQTPPITNVACKSDSTLQLTLSGSNLRDAKDRTGYIASNYQFQFDGPAQAGAIYTSGFSICGNGSLALGGSTTFYQCLSDNFYNLYDRNWAPQCEPVSLEVVELRDC